MERKRQPGDDKLYTGEKMAIISATYKLFWVISYPTITGKYPSEGKKIKNKYKIKA